MGYTKQCILDKCADALTDISQFYTKDFINYSGHCNDTGELYTEVIAKFLLAHIDVFRAGITKISRKASYKTQSHDGNFDLSSKRIEENIAKQMFAYCKDGSGYQHIGKIIDYQTPLKSSGRDVAGKIDLLAYDGKYLRLLELKKPDSQETMLRCVLEGFTYLQTLDTAKLLVDFQLPPNTIVKASPFVFKGGSQWKEMQENRPYLFNLMASLDSKPYYIIQNDTEFRVEE